MTRASLPILVFTAALAAVAADTTAGSHTHTHAHPHQHEHNKTSRHVQQIMPSIPPNVPKSMTHVIPHSPKLPNRTKIHEKPVRTKSVRPAATSGNAAASVSSTSPSFSTWSVVGIITGAVAAVAMVGVAMFSSGGGDQPKSGLASQIKIVSLTLVYCASGSLLSWANKVVSVGEHRLDLTVVLILQNTATFVLIWLFAFVAPGTVRALRVSSWGVIFKQFFPATAIFCAMLVTSLKAFQAASIAAVVVQRNLISLVVAAAEYIFLQKGLNAMAILSLVGILVGALVFGVTDVEFDQLGYGWLFANIAVSAAFQILNKKLVHGVDLSSFGFSYFNNLISVAMLLTYAVPSGALVVATTDIAYVNVTALVLSCFLGLGLSVSAFALSKEVSATTMMVVNNSNKFLLVIGIELLGLGKPIGLQGWLGCVLAIAFAMLYTRAKMMS